MIGNQANSFKGQEQKCQGRVKDRVLHRHKNLSNEFEKDLIS